MLNLTKYGEDLLDTDVSGDTNISDDSSSEEEGDEYDDDLYVEDTIKATEETVFRVETNGLLAIDTFNCEVCGQVRGKRGNKIHLKIMNKFLILLKSQH